MIDGGLRSLFKAKMPQGDWTIIETGMVSSGVPDANCCWDAVEFWVECKATYSSLVKMRPAQVGWLERRMRHGGKCFVAVRQRSHKTIAVDNLWLLSARAARPLATGERLETLAGGLVLGQWHNGPSNWPWPAVGAVLRQ